MFAFYCLQRVQLFLFSAFASWCIAQDLSYSSFELMDAEQDKIVQMSFLCGFGSVVIGSYFLLREVMQCFACVAEAGLASGPKSLKIVLTPNFFRTGAAYRMAG